MFMQPHQVAKWRENFCETWNIKQHTYKFLLFFAISLLYFGCDNFLMCVWDREYVCMLVNENKTFIRSWWQVQEHFHLHLSYASAATTTLLIVKYKAHWRHKICMNVIFYVIMNNNHTWIVRLNWCTWLFLWLSSFVRDFHQNSEIRVKMYGCNDTWYTVENLPIFKWIDSKRSYDIPCIKSCNALRHKMFHIGSYL